VLSAAGFDVHVYGHDHALIHKDIPSVVNTGFLVDRELFHPGDSFTVPEEPVRTLLVPIAGPWLRAEATGSDGKPGRPDYLFSLTAAMPGRKR
jgi:hypothetical protein